MRQFCSTTSIVWCTRRTRLLQCRAQCFLAGSAAEWHPTFPLHKTLGFYFESPSFDAFLLKISLERVIEATRIVEDRAVSSFKWKIESQPAVGRRVVSVPGFKNLEFRIQRSYVNHRDLLDLVSRISFLFLCIRVPCTRYSQLKSQVAESTEDGVLMRKIIEVKF